MTEYPSLVRKTLLYFGMVMLKCCQNNVLNFMVRWDKIIAENEKKVVLGKQFGVG